MEDAKKKIPVILDTDIGGDIDDSWALVMLLNCPEFDVKMILTNEEEESFYKAKITAKFLETAGRTDIPIGAGSPTWDMRGKMTNQAQWVRDFDLSKYPGAFRADGIKAMTECIIKAPEAITVIAIGPLGNLGAALDMSPEITRKAKVVGMQGSIRKGYFGADTPSAEYNVCHRRDCSQKVFSADWDITITPLDTCGNIFLKADKYRRILECQTPLIKALMENYRIWADAAAGGGRPDVYPGIYREQSTLLPDPAAVYLAMSEDFVNIEELGVEVTAEGFTRVNPSAKIIRCATSWKDYDSFENLLVERLVMEKKLL